MIVDEWQCMNPDCDSRSRVVKTRIDFLSGPKCYRCGQPLSLVDPAEPENRPPNHRPFPLDRTHNPKRVP